MSEFKPRSLSEIKEAGKRVFDPDAQGYLDAVGGASKLSTGIGNSDAIRSTNLDTSKARFGLPASDVAKSGLRSFFAPKQFAAKSEADLATQYRSLSNADLDRVKGLDAQELQANINRIKQYQPLANNEANRAMGMQLATQFPYKKYEVVSTSAREIMSNSQSAIPAFLNRATAARLNPVSMSL